MTNAAAAAATPTSNGDAAPAAASTTADTPVVADAATQPSATPDAQQPAADSGKPDAAKPDAPAPAAPEKYEFKSTDGTEYNPTVVTAFSEAAKAADLSQEKAQAFLDQLGAGLKAANEQVLKEVRESWMNDLKADKEIGGDQLDENLAVSKKFLDQFGDDELKKLLDETGLGGHRAIARAFVKAGKAISDDRVVPGGASPGASAQSPAQRMYPDMNP